MYVYLTKAWAGGKFAVLCVLDSDVDILANDLKQGLLSAAEETGTEEEDSALGHTGSVWPETTAKTTSAQALK